MSESNKNKGIEAGIASALGLGAGIAIGATIFSEDLNAEESIESNLNESTTNKRYYRTIDKANKDVNHTPSVNAHDVNSQQVETGDDENVNHGSAEEMLKTEILSGNSIIANSDPAEPLINTIKENMVTDVKVISYDWFMTKDGNHYDAAVLEVSGNIIEVVDTNLDGEAELLIYDKWESGLHDHKVFENVESMGIEMRHFQEAVDFIPTTHSDELTNYTNDTDITSFMA